MAKKTRQTYWLFRETIEEVQRIADEMTAESTAVDIGQVVNAAVMLLADQPARVRAAYIMRAYNPELHRLSQAAPEEIARAEREIEAEFERIGEARSAKPKRRGTA